MKFNDTRFTEEQKETIQNTHSKYKKVFLGVNKDKERIWLSPPSWDCGHYWGWGYIGNDGLHYHLSSLFKTKNMHDGLMEEFPIGFTSISDKDLWTFCELIRTFYHFREIAEVYNRGGSHYTTNPIKDEITNTKEYRRICGEIIPSIIDEVYKLINNNVK